MSIGVRLSDYFRSRDRGWMLSLFLTVCVLYGPFLGSPFIFDDLNLVGHDLAQLYGHSWFRMDLRWWPYASLSWTAILFSDVVTYFFHLGNLLLHAANVILLFYLMRTLTRAVAPELDQNRIAWGAWWAAMFFALHPVAVYAVGYVIQRSILMATLFALVMQLAYLRALLSGRVRWLILAVTAYFLAVFSKEHSVMMPAVLAGMTLLLGGRIVLGLRPLLLGWVALFIIAGLVIMRQQGVWGVPYEPMAGALFDKQGVVADTTGLHLLSVLTQAGLFFKYLLLWLLPNPAWMSIDMREPFIASLWDWRGWLGLVAFALYGVLGVRMLMRGGMRGLFGLALLYPWLQFVLEFSSIRVQEPFVLYRSYLWMPGFLLLIPLAMAWWRPNRRLWPALLAVLVLIAVAAGNRLWVMADNYRLWSDAASLLANEQMPGADRIYFNLGQAAVGKGRRDEAISNFKRALNISPQYAPVHFELGWQYGMMGRYDEALAQFNEAIALDPTFANAYYGKGMIMKLRHDDRQAAALMERSCELKNAMACLITKGHIGR